jgi:hypothetical protein
VGETVKGIFLAASIERGSRAGQGTGKKEKGKRKKARGGVL